MFEYGSLAVCPRHLKAARADRRKYISGACNDRCGSKAALTDPKFDSPDRRLCRFRANQRAHQNGRWPDGQITNSDLRKWCQAPK